MSGADIQTIFRHLSGGNGASSYDGLQDMMSRRYTSFALNNPLRPQRDIVQRNASAFIDTLGINPFTGFGQGLTDLVSSMYTIAPDAVGAFIGLPNSGSFYQQIANGSAGISKASGQGIPSIFNPYSARDSYNNAVSLARRVHDFANIDGKGFNMDFTHGLNMDEVGFVAQRLLSSKIPYTRYTRRDDGTVDELGIDVNSEEFSNNLKNLGSKFNEAASMLAKITGSVKDAVDLMDRLGGGNFLGGTADDALAVARKAKNMAANIRITSAMAGVDPKEAYANIVGMQQGLVSRYGINPMLAAASNFDTNMMDPSYRATMAYQTWAAQNPGASQRDKMMVMAGAQARVMQYANTNGENLAAMVSANKEKFSEDDLKAIETAYRMGRPNDIRRMVRDRMGAESYDDYMRDPAAIMGFRLSGDKELQNRFANAAYEGNLRLAEVEGGRRMLRNDLNATDRELSKVSGDSRYRGKDRREASAVELRKLAVQNGMSEDFAATRDALQLRAYLMDSGVDARVIERTENTAAINEQLREIVDLTMTSDEEKDAKTRLKNVIRASSTYSDAKKTSMVAAVDAEGADINDIYDQFLKDSGQRYSADNDILGKKMSSAHASKMRRRLEGHQKYWAVENTPEEMKRAVDAMAGQFSIRSTAELAGTVEGEAFSKANNDSEALDVYAKSVGALVDAGTVSIGNDNKRLDATFESAAKSIVSEIFNGHIGNINDTGKDGKKNKDFNNIVSDVTSRMMKEVRGGKSINNAFAIAMDSVRQGLDEKSGVGKAIGEEGLAQIDKWIKDARDSESELVEKSLNRKSLASAATTVINGNTAKQITDASKDMFDSLDSKDSKSGDRFYESAKKLAAAGALDKEAFGKIDRKSLGTREGRMAALEKMAPDAYNKRLDAIRASVGTGDVQTATIAWVATMAERAGVNYNNVNWKDFGVSEDKISDLVRGLDDSSASRNQNALSRAINLGSGSFGREEVERSRKMIGDLRDRMNDVGITSEDLESYKSAKDEDKKGIRDSWAKKLETATYKDAKGNERKVFEDSEYAAKFVSALVEKGKIGDIDVSKMLSDKSIDLKKLDNTALAGVTKDAYKKDSVAHDIFEIVTKISDNIGLLVTNPVSAVITGYSTNASLQNESGMANAINRNSP